MKITKELTLIGHVSVDAGMVWIGDPCYVLHTELPETLGRTWTEFCGNLNRIDTDGYQAFSHNKDIDGLGIVANTKHGDGYYPVYAVFEDESKTPSAIMVDFNNITDKITWKKR
jgi:hypothetical protein